MIGLGQAASIYAGLTWTRLKRGRLLWVCAALLALPVLGTGALVIAGHWGRGLFDDVMELYFRFLLPFVPALLASPVVAEEIDGKTHTFLFARPAPRSALVLGKFFAVTVPAAAAVVLSIGAVWLLSMIRFPGDMGDNLGHLARASAAALVGTAAFAALASAIGTIFTRHPFVAVVGYLLVVEAGLGSAPILLNLLSISWHLRNFADLPVAEASFMSIHVPAWLSASLAVGITGITLGGASLAVAGAEYHAR